jgi:hypothetical protein
MGLADKILESYKHWVNLEVEDFHDEITDGVQSVYKLAKHQHKLAIEAYELACTVASANPHSDQAKKMEHDADKARIAAKKEESKTKEVYTDTM